MSLFTDGLPAWWAMVVAVAALGVGMWLGEVHGRGVGRGQEREDRAAARAVRQVRSWREGREERTAAFLNPPEVHHEERPSIFAQAMAAGAAEVDRALYGPEDDWRRHEETALALAREDTAARQALTDTGWTRRMAGDMDEFIARLLAEHPVTEES
jgi:uncharacterized protein YjiS (DUF1127 family)